MVKPEYFPASLFNVPSLFIQILGFNFIFLIASTSYLSPYEHIIIMPVPFLGSAESSPIIGTTWLNKGTFTFFPIKFLYLLSLG